MADVTDDLPIPLQELATGLDSPSDLALGGNEIFVCGRYEGRIYKLDYVLSTKTAGVDSQITLFPNPSNGFLFLSNVRDPTPYRIYSLDGKKVSEGEFVPGGQIDVRRLPPGMFVLQLAGGRAVPFVKR